MEDWVTIRNLDKRGVSQREISRLLNISRNTVKKAVESEKAPEYSREEVVNAEIKPFTDYIEKRLHIDNLIGSRILSEITSKGYKGSQSAFYRYLSKIEQAVKRTYKPYETAPAEQAQFDWSEYTVTLSGRLTKVYVFSYILGYSRYRIYTGSLSQTAGSIFEALEDSIIETRGVVQRLQTDNAKSFIINAGRSNLEYNPRYLAFCGHYGIKPTRSLPKHPWSKGKVERPFNYLEEHFIKGNEFENFDDFISRLKKFQEEVNNRIHSTTRKPPKELYEEEKNSLKSLPATRYVDIKEEVRKVTGDCMISYNGSRYSVPRHFVKKEVWLKISKGCKLLIYSSKNTLIAAHDLSPEKGRTIMVEEHYKDHKIERGNWDRLTQDFIRLFSEEQTWFLDKLHTQKNIDPNYHLTRILEISKYYQTNDMINSFNDCKKYNFYSCAFVRAFLENHGEIAQKPIIPIDSNILQSIPKENIKRDLSDYNLMNYC